MSSNVEPFSALYGRVRLGLTRLRRRFVSRLHKHLGVKTVHNPYTTAMTRILKEAVAFREYFEKHPKALAYWMQWYSDLHYASRHDPNENLHDWVNLKYAIIDMEEDPSVGKKYANFIYDAWGASIHEEPDSKYGKPHPLESKINKTVDEWVTLCLDPKYRYHSVYSDRLRVLDHLLCTNGTGLEWNRDGFICHRAIADEEGDMDIFLGYSINGIGRRQLPEPLKRLIQGWRMHKVMFHGFKNMLAAKRRQKAEDRKLDRAHKTLQKELKALLKKQGKTYEDHVKEVFPGMKGNQARFYPMSEGYCRLLDMPKNAHPSYIVAGKEICEAILNDPIEASNRDNGKLARKFLNKWFGGKENASTAEA